MNTEITRGICYSCGFKEVCNEVKNKKRNCIDYRYDWALEKHMKEQKLDPNSADDKKRMLELERLNAPHNKRCMLIFKSVVFVIFLFLAALWTMHLWLPCLLRN